MPLWPPFMKLLVIFPASLTLSSIYAFQWYTRICACFSRWLSLPWRKKIRNRIKRTNEESILMSFIYLHLHFRFLLFAVLYSSLWSLQSFQLKDHHDYSFRRMCEAYVRIVKENALKVVAMHSMSLITIRIIIKNRYFCELFMFTEKLC